MDPPSTLAQRLAARYAERIAQGLLRPGASLPSVRRCATENGVSPSTVVAAYDQLQARGLIEARPQRGFFVRHDPAAPGHRAPARRPTLAPPIDAQALLRGMLSIPRGAASPGSGTLPTAWLDDDLLKRTLRRAAGSTDMRRYGEPAGDPALRAAMLPLLAERGLPCSADQLIATAGASHGMDIVARTLLAPGDAVLVDDPGWTVEYARLSRLGMVLLPVPRNADGPDLAVMTHLARTHRPRLYVTVPVLHHPTGGHLSPAVAHQVLRLAEQHDFAIVEDDAAAWFAPPHLPRLAALDGLRRCVYVGSFSKILAPDWRVGFIAAPAPWVQRLVDTKTIAGLTTPAVTEQAVAACLTGGLLRRHASRVNERLDAARQRSRRLAEEAGCRFVATPQGLFGWVDTGVDTDALAQALLDDGWLLAPGSLFHVTHQASRLMRINFATSQDARFWQDFARRRRTLK